jgi:predicted O-linked N-acetylglucosamine transferase (SPINDLY family)
MSRRTQVRARPAPGQQGPVQQVLAQGLAHHQAGRLAEAEAAYRRVLQAQPEQPDALHLLGVLALQAGRPADAVTRIRKAVAQRPDSATYQANLGVALQATGQVEEARTVLERAVGLDPRHVDALFNLGVTLQTLGLLDQAAERYQRVLALVSGHPGARRNLGNALHALGRHAEAAEAYRLLLGLVPADAGLLGSLGTALAAQERHAEAVEAFEAAVRLAPSDADAWLNLAMARHHAARHDADLYEAAIEAYQRALTLRPDHAEGWQSLGRALSASDRPAGAVEAHQRALALLDAGRDGPSAGAALRLSVLRDLVSALYVDGRRGEAARVLRSVVDLAPEDADSWRHLGMTLATSGSPDEAVLALERAVALDPSHADARSKLIFVLDLLPTTTVEQAFQARRAFNEHHGLPLAAEIRPHTNAPEPERRLRVGYVSADFRRHSASSAFLTILEHHDPSVVEVVCYANVVPEQEDAITERFKACAALWRPITELSDEELAAQIRADEIDVLVDLSGHSGGHRLLAFARKPAPVQVTAWGYATGTGLDAIDAYFSDPVLVPPHEERFYAERVVHLPNVLCYTPPPVLPPIPPLPVLSNGYVTFGSFNRAVKITPDVLETWARVLHAVPKSRLVLKPTTESATERQRLLEPLAALGVEPERVEILAKSPHLEHIASFGRIDIQLDTFPHAGGITTLEGLLMAVPCVTVFGERVSGRSSASFLTTLGLEDLVARTTDEYVEIAARLAGNVERLAHERATLRERLLTSPIGDGVTYTRAVEEAYRGLWRRWCDERVESRALRGESEATDGLGQEAAG